jgi:hypothetical protein
MATSTPINSSPITQEEAIFNQELALQCQNAEANDVSQTNQAMAASNEQASSASTAAQSAVGSSTARITQA